MVSETNGAPVRKVVILITVFVLAACLVTACGSNSSGTETGSSTGTTGEATTGGTTTGGTTTGGSMTGGAATADGQALVEQKCTVCHGLDRIQAKSENKEQWSAIVDQMVAKGAQLSPEEKTAVVDYLAATYGE